MTAPEYSLGQAVWFTGILRRGWSAEHDPPRESGGWGKGWRRYRSATGAGHPGIIVGKRTLTNGIVRGVDVGHLGYTPRERFTAYLVAFDLHRKPVFVRPEDLRTEVPVLALEAAQ